ncbi:Hypothetical predicted protein [Olea europaea subsp. europaea]|uniref:KIB1-4 beta-propeller domain-containing protein n=1 Tax=Olea europaea subsp. europaea TaxID=158383 RepID=A0A8S0PIY4_OLEEU|nr:Hypothetical predicted protein [Olea europaea subsp. europaea]
MVQKTKKGGKFSPGKEATPTPNPKPWPNLPPRLTSLIAIQPSLMQNITALGGTTKSWRVAPACYRKLDDKPRMPQLVEINATDYKRPQHSHKIDVSFHEKYFFFYYKRRSYQYRDPWIYFKGYSHGQLVAMSCDLSKCCLREPEGKCTRYLPCWDCNLPFKFATLSSSPKDWKFPTKYTKLSSLPKHQYGCNVMVLTGICSPAFAFFRLGKDQKGWIVENCTLTEPYALNQHMQFTNAIGFQGKFYALSLQGSLAVIEDIDSRFQITARGANRAVPSVVSRQFREYLLESNGEIFLVFLISRKSVNVVDDVEVFRLDICKLLWVKVESLGDMMFFVEDECCMSLSASKVGCRGNCIYFTHHRVKDWWVFDMETCCISPTSGPNIEFTKSPMWDELMEQ